MSSWIYRLSSQWLVQPRIRGQSLASRRLISRRFERFSSNFRNHRTDLLCIDSASTRNPTWNSAVGVYRAVKERIALLFPVSRVFCVKVAIV